MDRADVDRMETLRESAEKMFQLAREMHEEASETVRQCKEQQRKEQERNEREKSGGSL